MFPILGDLVRREDFLGTHRSEKEIEGGQNCAECDYFIYYSRYSRDIVV